MKRMETTINKLIELGLTTAQATELHQQIHPHLSSITPETSWQALSPYLSAYPFPVHLYLFTLLFPQWRDHPEQAPAWLPSAELKKHANLARYMHEQGITDRAAFHRWTVENNEIFWQQIIKKLGITFQQPPTRTCDLKEGIASPEWLPGAKLNISDSCFTAKPTKTALIYQDPQKHLRTLSYQQLNHISQRIANSLHHSGMHAGDSIAIAMPMTIEAVAIYLGIIKMGGVVVSIADSFSSEEIATRLQIAKTKAIFTQDYVWRNNKKLPLYERVAAAHAPLTIVLPSKESVLLPLRDGDLTWQTFLLDDSHFDSVACNPMQPCNILFSSGTTGAPKAIPWNHTTPIKAASDAYLHHNIQPGDILAWPTNLGWMMGPWLIFAALINQATIAIYPDTPIERAFGEFVQSAKVTMLGVVPTIVTQWRQSACMEGLDWHTIKAFSSSGECSNAEDMLYLMSLAGYKPVIEYCGGTEIGGAYISSTMLDKNYPSLFTTPTMGLDLLIIDENGQPTDNGEVAIVPPSIGLSTNLVNANHHAIYYENMPLSPSGKVLRRHGDQIKRLPNSCYCILGRADDTMNLGGIKISSAEIERALAGLEEIIETAAIATLGNGPSQLIIYATTKQPLDKASIKKKMQDRINRYLNPLFKIHDVIFLSELPKTASNKIIRRML